MSLETEIKALTAEVKNLIAALGAQSAPVVAAPVAVATPVAVAPVAVAPVAPVAPVAATPVAATPVAATPAAATPAAAAMPVLPTFQPPAATPAAAAPFTDPTGLMNYTMAKYQTLGPDRGAGIQQVLLTLGVQNMNDLKPEQYTAYWTGCEAL